MSRLRGLAPVFRREFKSYFSSPLGYVFIVIFLLASGYLTVSRDFGRFLEIRQANLDAFFAYVPWIFVVLVPAVAMRLWAEERKSGTVELLLTLPISLEGAYLGKFLAGWCFLDFSLLLTWPVVFQVARLGDPDWGVILAGYIGCGLAAGAFLSIGMLFSAMSKNQVVAFILGVAASTAFLLLGLPETLDYVGGALGGYVEQVLASLSLIDHFESLTRGLVELRTLAFFALFTGGWLAIGMLTLRETKGN
ncbi:MAG: ABC transporter permease [Acidobacteriota bacterium]|nr:ABC transporter permease [Acidobacteriota bacterium]